MHVALYYQAEIITLLSDDDYHTAFTDNTVLVEKIQDENHAIEVDKAYYSSMMRIIMTRLQLCCFSG